MKQSLSTQVHTYCEAALQYIFWTPDALKLASDIRENIITQLRLPIEMHGIKYLDEVYVSSFYSP